MEDKVAKLEGDLEALSQAYATLESYTTEMKDKFENSARNEDDDAMEDLLVCLGQEEEKVSRLESQLRALGVEPG